MFGIVVFLKVASHDRNKNMIFMFHVSIMAQPTI